MDYGDFFRFTKQERRGILAFLVITIGFLFLIDRLKPVPVAHEHDLSSFYLSGDTINGLSEKDQESQGSDWELIKDEYTRKFRDEKKAIKNERFAFDPNSISSDSLMLLGFSAFGSKNLVNYISKGGRIYNSQKFKQIYGMDTTLINELEGLIRYPVKAEKSFVKTDSLSIVKKPEKVQQVVELNAADSLTLDALKGVGPYTVKKILRQREKLGGFLKKEQLLEFGLMPDSVYRTLETYLKADPALIQKIDINTADYKTFTRHPYFSPETVNAILRYRKQHGDFREPGHISRIISLKRETGEKILPYLKVEK